MKWIEISNSSLKMHGAAVPALELLGRLPLGLEEPTLKLCLAKLQRMS